MTLRSSMPYEYRGYRTLYLFLSFVSSGQLFAWRACDGVALCVKRRQRDSSVEQGDYVLASLWCGVMCSPFPDKLKYFIGPLLCFLLFVGMASEVSLLS